MLWLFSTPHACFHRNEAEGKITLQALAKPLSCIAHTAEPRPMGEVDSVTWTRVAHASPIASAIGGTAPGFLCAPSRFVCGGLTPIAHRPLDRTTLYHTRGYAEVCPLSVSM